MSNKKSFLWALFERIGSVGLQFVLQLIIARILLPSDYGICAILLVFVNICTLFIEGGLPAALIQQKNCSTKDYSTVFFITFVLSCVFYGVIFFLSPFIAEFFSNDIIIPGLRIISLTLVLGSFNSVQIAVLRKSFQFKKIFISNTIATILSSFISIYLAYKGSGAWAIIIQIVTQRIISTIITFLLLRWYPHWVFSWDIAKKLFSYGWKLMMSNILSVIVTDIYTIIIGRHFSKSELGLYDTGTKIPNSISSTISSTLTNYLFPLYSSFQDDSSKIKTYIKKSNSVCSFIMFPMMFCMAAMADPLIRIVLTDKWSNAAIFMQLACFLYAFYPIHMNNLQAINAIGRSDIGLKLEIIKKGLDLLFLIAFIPWGIVWLAFGRMLTSIIGLWINMSPNKKLVNYSFREQIGDILPTLAISLIVFVIIIFVSKFIKTSDIHLLSIQILISIISYSILSYLFNRKILFSVLSIINIKH